MKKNSQYNHNSYVLDTALAELNKREESELEDSWDLVAPSAQSNEREDKEEGIHHSSEYSSYDPPSPDIKSHSDLGRF